jgi:lysophospholipase L1-like esterase
MIEEIAATEGVAGQFTLPHVDQAGFQDENGNDYQNWYYTATVQYMNDRVTLPAKTKVFQLLAGQSVVDLDKLPSGVPALPYTAPIAGVTSVAGQTGTVTALDIVNAPDAVTALNATYQPKGEHPRGWFGRGLVPIATRYARFDFSGTSNGTDLATNSRIAYTPHTDALTVRAAWYNAATVPVTIKAGHEDNAGIIRPVTFNGETSKVIQPNQWALSDIINKRSVKGAVSYIRTYMTVTTGQVWHYTHIAGDAGEQVERGASLTDKSASGTLTSVGGATFGPVGLLYQPASRVPSVSGLGDSIMGGTGTSATTAVSFMRKALEGKRSLTIAQRGGETLEAYVSALDAGSSAGKDPLTLSNSRYMLAQAGNWLLGNYGINDIRKPRTAAQIKTDMVGVWTRAAAEGQLVTWTTLTPNSQTTDAWATVANQTVNTGQNAERVAVNVWLRAGAPIDPTTKLNVAVGTSGALLAGQEGHPLYKVIDVCTGVEAGQDTGKWLAPGYTTDGLHPNDLATQAMADTVTAAMTADPKLFS